MSFRLTLTLNWAMDKCPRMLFLAAICSISIYFLTSIAQIKHHSTTRRMQSFRFVFDN
jgi:amino acid permease